MTRIPITLLTGYLGSGKTTVLNHLLAGTPGLRLGVLVNDFGAVNIDAALIRQRDETAVELSNGCVCCSVGDDLGEALTAMAMRPAPPERIVMEASGVADPGRLAMSVGHWPGFELDAVITVIDAETIRRRAGDKFVGQLVRSQVRQGDILALTRTDLMSRAQLRDIRDWLGTQHPDPRVIEAPHGRIPAEILLGPSGRAPRRPLPEVTGHSGFTRFLWRPEGPVDRAALTETLSALPAHIHRAKGTVTEAATGRGLSCQRAGARLSIEETDAPRDGCLVLISAEATFDATATLSALDATCRQAAPG